MADPMKTFAGYVKFKLPLSTVASLSKVTPDKKREAIEAKLKELADDPQSLPEKYFKYLERGERRKQFTLYLHSEMWERIAPLRRLRVVWSRVVEDALTPLMETKAKKKGKKK
jgi:hypothetical protein